MFAFNQGELRYYDLFHWDKDYKEEARQLPLNGKKVLEIGSGTGLMTKELRDMGYQVATVDPNCPADYAHLKEIPAYEKFDTVLALYDVLNYMPPKEREWTEARVNEMTNNFIYEVWQGDYVKPFTHREVDGCHRIRLGFKRANKAHLLFIYWGKGLALAYHKLYLHETNS